MTERMWFSAVAWGTILLIATAVISAAIAYLDRRERNQTIRERERAYRLARRQRAWERIRNLDQEWM